MTRDIPSPIVADRSGDAAVNEVYSFAGNLGETGAGVQESDKLAIRDIRDLRFRSEGEILAIDAKAIDESGPTALSDLGEDRCLFNSSELGSMLADDEKTLGIFI